MLILAWSLGPADFGLYGVIISLLVWLERIDDAWHSRARPPSWSRRARTPSHQLRCCSVWCWSRIVVVALWVLRSRDGSSVQAPGQEALFRLAALDVPFYGMYLVYRGVAMGERKFTVVFWSGLILGIRQADRARLDRSGRLRHFRGPDRLCHRIGRGVLVPRSALTHQADVPWTSDLARRVVQMACAARDLEASGCRSCTISTSGS